MRVYIVAASALALLGGRAEAQSDPLAEFRWTAPATAGMQLRVTNVRGSVSVGPARPGRQAIEVVAAKSWRRGRPAAVNIHATSVDGVIVVCVTTATTCDGPARWDSRLAGDVAVDLAITVPAGMPLSVATTNGDVSVTAESPSVEAQTTNGNVAVQALDGRVLAATINGSVHAWLGQRPDASVRLQGMVFRSDFDIAVVGRVRAGEMRGTIGRGGRSIDLRAVRGSVALRQGRAPASGLPPNGSDRTL